MRNASSIATLVAVLLVAFAAKLDRAMVAAAADPAVIAATETAPAQTAPTVLAQFNPCPNGKCVR